MINALFKPSSLIGIVALLVSSFLLFEIKYRVQDIRRELNQIELDTLKAEEDIHILKAEWTFITKPETLSKLTKKHLNLTTIDPAKIKHLNPNELNKLFEDKKTNIDEAKDKTT
jgi:hypothetical protein